ncbi:CU044_5270 family protein [Streptomyces sp. NBC_01304]|uniref:CU044_5270 family protein n=1 Tax=Streptomyces sp. NBC_01304 TaxID=2903818 RepID=UPI002E14E77E|nr:CU044_5270 family protein [Streptomyces sp. NBC_01304]
MTKQTHDRRRGDVLDRLAGARPAHLDPDRPVTAETRVAELTRAMRGTPRTAARRRPYVKPAWGIGLVATGTAIAALAVTLNSGSDNAAPQQDAFSWKLGQQQAPTGTVAARPVLRAAAATALKERTPKGRYLKVDYDYWQSFPIRDTEIPYTIVGGVRMTAWSDIRTGGLIGPQKEIAYAPSTEADLKAWKKDGSPNPAPIDPKVPYRVSGGTVGDIGDGPFKVLFEARENGMERFGRIYANRAKPYYIGRAVTLKELRALPTDVKALRADLMTGWTGDAKKRNPTQEGFLFEAAHSLILDLPVEPALRAAAFKMLADLEDVTVQEKAVDVAGRTGAAVVLDQKDSRGGVLRQRLLFDRQTSRGLTYDISVVEPGGRYQSFAPGANIYSEVVKKMVWTNEGPPKSPRP